MQLACVNIPSHSLIWGVDGREIYVGSYSFLFQKVQEGEKKGSCSITIVYSRIGNSAMECLDYFGYARNMYGFRPPKGYLVSVFKIETLCNSSHCLVALEVR